MLCQQTQPLLFLTASICSPCYFCVEVISEAEIGIALHLISLFFSLEDKHLAFAAFKAASGFSGFKIHT